MILSKEQQEQVRELAKPLAQWMADNLHPHTEAKVTSTHVEITEGVMRAPLDTYIPD